MKILLMEDDEILNEVITQNLQSKGYDICSTYDGEDAEEAIYENSFDLLLLDVNVPTINGFELLKNLRDNNINIPAIFITSLNGTEDLQEGFDMGCDDYIKKPFEFKELELRINNIKRLYKLDSTNIVKIDSKMSYNFKTSSVIKDKQNYELSIIEAKIFEYLFKNKNRPVSTNEIGVNVWAYDDIPSDATIRTHIKNIRKILGKDFITTIKGVGYHFNSK